MAFPTGEGAICRITHVVTLEEAGERKREGWVFVGPDPKEWEVLQEYERNMKWYQRW